MGFQYTTYKDFVRYCLNLCKNIGYKYTEEDVESIIEFENIVKLLIKLEEDKIIEIDCDLCRCIVDLLISNPGKTFYCIKFVLNKFIKMKEDVISFSDFCVLLEDLLKLQLQFTKYFIDNYDEECFYYPERVRIYEIFVDKVQMFGITKKDKQEMNHFGVYFIYDENSELAYIGKSLTCVIKRSIGSVKERQLQTFSKIEYRYPRTKSDVAIYEAYYIAKYKPKKNNDMIFKDELTIELPELPISHVMEANEERSYKQEYRYYAEKLIDIDEYKKLKHILYLKNSQNKRLLENNHIYGKQKSKILADENCREQLKVKRLTLMY